MIQEYLYFARDVVFLLFPILLISFLVLSLLTFAIGFIGWMIEKSKE
jgi:hypothetical protein